MIALHRLARFCIISSLHDGMNLVAKEFVASRSIRKGFYCSLASRARHANWRIHAVQPVSTDELAAAILQAVEMDSAEQKRRMQRMQHIVQENNVYRWAGKILSTLLSFDFPESTE